VIFLLILNLFYFLFIDETTAAADVEMVIERLIDRLID